MVPTVDEPLFTTMMRCSEIIVALATIGSAVAQRPTNTSICDYYTAALFKSNTADNQHSLLVALVNTVVIGNCKSTYQPDFDPSRLPN